ncbi:hypothetical protein BaRGS_00030076 [Batillaria attramentaria]|uniref:Integrase catalytic domain-containing protein n=1 Tax=Batillaria attramentaria TaxID=370345 RepID=A0ABD0JVF1_9CAEN
MTPVPEPCWLPTIPPEEMKEKQRADCDLRRLAEWKEAGPNPPWSVVRRESPTLRNLWAQWEAVELENGVLRRRLHGDCQPHGRYQIIAPAELRREIFRQRHDVRVGRHQGMKRTLANVRRRFWWPGQRKDIDRWCRVCPTCQFRKPRSGAARAPLQQDTASAPFGRIAMDILSFPRATEEGNTCVPIVDDYYTKFTLAFALPSHKAVTVADVLVTEVFLVFGTPRVIHLDHGPEFQSELMKELYALLEIKQTRTTSYRPYCDRHVVKDVHRKIWRLGHTSRLRDGSVPSNGAQNYGMQSKQADVWTRDHSSYRYDVWN